jgi:imidazolonepropionase-like amidohydrolase
LRSGKMTRKEADSIYNSTFDAARAAGEYSKLAKKGLYVCPTLIGSYQLAYLKETDHSKDLFLQFLTQKYVSNYEWRIQRMANETPAQLQLRKDRLEMLKKQLPAMQAAGLVLMAGSDAAALNTYVYPAESLIKELEIFAEAGLTPLQILQSATMAGARYFNVTQKTSSVDVGKNADLVLLDENPLDNISNVRKVNSVVAKGVYYDRAQLDRMLLQAKNTKTRLDKERTK